MAPFGTSVEGTKAIRRRMLQAKVFEKDICESFIRSSGPGGQNVNKVSTCVALHHLPSGIQVKSQQGRTQGSNRYKARCLLVAKIEQRRKDQQQAIAHDKAKRKRQNRKRSRASKEKMLEKKRHRSERKYTRRKIKAHKLEGY